MRWCIIAVLVLLIVLPLYSTEAQTPDVMLNLPAKNFVGEQFCFSAEITNSGGPGYGPYLHLILPPEITLDSATFLNLGVTTTTIGVFPAAPDNQLADPITGDPITEDVQPVNQTVTPGTEAYPVRFGIKTDELDAPRQPVEAERVQSFNVSIPNDPLSMAA